MTCIRQGSSVNSPETGRVAVKSADRALAILELFTSNPRPRSYSELLRETGLPKSSLHGLLLTLVHRGWLTEIHPGGLYALDVQTLAVGASYIRSRGHASIGPILDELAAEVQETVNLAVRDGGDVVYIAVRRSPHALTMRSAVGLRLPAYATGVGKALLSRLDDDAVAALLPAQFISLARRTRTSTRDVLHDLEVIRTTGYATESEEATDGIGCIAVALPRQNLPPLGLSLAYPLARPKQRAEQDLLSTLRGAAEKLTAAFTIDPEIEIE